MDDGLRLAWTRIVTADDYEEHMAAIGQAQAGAVLTRFLITTAKLPDNGRLVIVGAGTGQMFDFLDPALFRHLQMICTDLNPGFLTRLQKRLTARGLNATILEDDIEHTTIQPGADLLLATLVLEHIDWRRGVAVFAQLRPAACGIVIQQNPGGMASAVTPGRRIPASISKAVEIAHPVLVPQADLIAMFDELGYTNTASWAEDVADGKRLVAMLLVRRTPGLDRSNDQTIACMEISH